MARIKEMSTTPENFVIELSLYEASNLCGALSAAINNHIQEGHLYCALALTKIADTFCPVVWGPDNMEPWESIVTRKIAAREAEVVRKSDAIERKSYAIGEELRRLVYSRTVRPAGEFVSNVLICAQCATVGDYEMGDSLTFPEMCHECGRSIGPKDVN